MIALVIAVAYLVAAIVGWRGPHRKRRLVRFVIFLGTYPVFVAMAQALLWGVFLPSLEREGDRQRQDHYDADSFVHVGNPAPSFTLKRTIGDGLNVHQFEIRRDRQAASMADNVYRTDAVANSQPDALCASVTGDRRDISLNVGWFVC